jgi:hypothetical protein
MPDQARLLGSKIMNKNMGKGSSSSAVLDIFDRPRMMWAMFIDGRVSAFYKLIPIGAFLWILLPDFVPGGLDDLVVAYFGPQFFLELCRKRYPQIYSDHYRRLFPEKSDEKQQR